MVKTPKPPYTSVSDVDAFFDRVKTIAEPQPPKKVDSAWVESYKFKTAHPSAIPSMQRWLGVINDDGESTGVWNEIRVEGTRQAALQRLVKGAYADVFDTIEVEQATNADLLGAFVQAYAIGDPKRQIACFLSLCQHAGIKTAQEPPPAREAKADSGRGALRAEPRRAPASTNGASKTATATRRRETRESVTATNSVLRTNSVTVALNVEIPADWTEEQIRERIAAVTRAVEAASSGDS